LPGLFANQETAVTQIKIEVDRGLNLDYLSIRIGTDCHVAVANQGILRTSSIDAQTPVTRWIGQLCRTFMAIQTTDRGLSTSRGLSFGFLPHAIGVPLPDQSQLTLPARQIIFAA
jgi:hypothetical protein